MKISKVQKRERLDFTEGLLVELYSTREIIAMLRDRFGIGHRAAEYYIADVQKRWLAESNANREAKIAEIEHTTNATIREARAAQNYGAAVQALNLKAKLHGLASRVELTGKNGGAVEVLNVGLLHESLRDLRACVEALDESTAEAPTTATADAPSARNE